MEIETPRRLLRNWKEEAFGAFARMNQDPHVMRFFPSVVPVQDSIEKARALTRAFPRAFQVLRNSIPGMAMTRFLIGIGVLAMLLAPRAASANPPTTPLGSSIREAKAVRPMTFWDEQPCFGANCMDETPPSLAYLKSARGRGIRWLRLTWDKWKGQGRDFLLGNADGYEGLVPADLEVLMATLDRAQVADLKVVVVPLSLPGMRWRQNNGDLFDGRIWQSKVWWEQAARFWGDLAARIKGHPAVVGYNLVNEPAPELNAGVREDASPDQLQAWYRTVRGSARDLPAFYHRVAQAIRETD